MDHKGFSIVHVQSPCTTYNDTYQLLKGNKKLGIAPIAWEIPEAHDKSDINAAHDIVDKGGVPLGILFEDKVRASFDENINKLNEKVKPRNPKLILILGLPSLARKVLNLFYFLGQVPETYSTFEACCPKLASNFWLLGCP